MPGRGVSLLRRYSEGTRLRRVTLRSHAEGGTHLQAGTSL